VLVNNGLINPLSLLDPDDGSSIFIRKVGPYPLDYAVSPCEVAEFHLLVTV